MKKRLDRRCLVGLGALVVALVCFAAGTAVAATLSVTGNGQWSGSDSGNTFTESGTLSGPPYFLPGSSFSGTQTTGSTIGTIPECTTGSTSMSGSLTLTAANGDVLNTSVLGTVCKFIPNPAFPGWVFTGNYTITGGTGQFTGASGSGLAGLSFPDFPAPPGFQFLLSLFGSINFPQHSTATEVSCTPQPVVAGNSTTCTATVTDTAANGQTTPTGTVSFTSSGPGTFGSGGSCMLTAASSSSASCSVTYTPGSTPANPVRTDTITATYNGDATHTGSSTAQMPKKYQEVRNSHMSRSFPPKPVASE